MAGQSPSSSLLSSSALKAPSITWGMEGGAREDHRGREASLWEGWIIGRGDVRGGNENRKRLEREEGGGCEN
jgi:hypothetical protein